MPGTWVPSRDTHGEDSRMPQSPPSLYELQVHNLFGLSAGHHGDGVIGPVVTKDDGPSMLTPTAVLGGLGESAAEARRSRPELVGAMAKNVGTDGGRGLKLESAF